jgi:hypothetical protein
MYQTYSEAKLKFATKSHHLYPIYVHKAILSYPACGPSQKDTRHASPWVWKIPGIMLLLLLTIKIFCFCSEFSTLMIPSVSDIIAKFRTAHKWVHSRARIFKRLWSPGIDSKELIPPAYVASGGPVRWPYSYSVPSTHGLFKNSSSVIEKAPLLREVETNKKAIF